VGDDLDRRVVPLRVGAISAITRTLARSDAYDTSADRQAVTALLSKEANDLDKAKAINDRIYPLAHAFYAPPFLDMHAAAWQPDGSYRMRDDARRFENWETYVAGKIALGVAADYALDLGLDAIWERDQALAERLRDGLGDRQGVTVHDQGSTRGAIVTFRVAGRRAADVWAALAAERVNVSITEAESARLDLDERGIHKMVRASVHYFNTEQEVDRLVELVAA
jgi:selenocysteine lyase/cysteine desulfurase